MTKAELITREASSRPPFRFAISATFTAEPLEPALQFWARELGRDVEIRFAPYNQLVQTLLAPDSAFASNHFGINVLLVRLEDLASFGGREPAVSSRIETNLRELVDSVRSAAASLGAPLIFCLCPSSPAFSENPEFDALARRACSDLSSALNAVAGVQFLDYDQIARWYPVSRWFDPDGERLGRIPYTELYFVALATALVRLTCALFQPSHKVIVLDCDNTLWRGICGEDGPHGVELDPGRRALHEFMLGQRDAGMLLSMVSKNNERDVLETFRVHPEMPLQLGQFVSWRINWHPKTENLASLSDELSLGLDSFIMLDDSAMESAEVAESFPEVLSLTLPEDAARIPHFLDHVWAFDHPVITEEDRNRSSYYSQSQEFGREYRRATNLAQFVAGLNLKVTFSELRPETLPRISQLTHRTNQFNCTTIRRSEAEIRTPVDAGELDCRAVEVSDRFGDYGLVGVVLFARKPDELVVDTFLLSCRTLGRGVEHRVLASLGETAVAEGRGWVSVPLHRTAKNLPALEFLQSVGSEWQEETPDGFLFRFPAEKLPGLEWRPVSPQALPAPRRSAQQAPARRFVDFARIAASLTTPEEILEAMRRRRQNHAASQPSYETETESQLAAIWAELLEKPAVSAQDNFFDLGGHSLLAVLLLLRVREAFGVELTIDDVYSGTVTLADLARKIEHQRAGGLTPDDYARLVAEVDALSEEEVGRLLAEAEAQAGGSRP